MITNSNEPFLPLGEDEFMSVDGYEEHFSDKDQI